MHEIVNNMVKVPITEIEKSGVLEEARNAIDHHLEQERKKKQQRTKQLIKAKVPYMHREKELAKI